jgi:hypothetical protein
VFFFSDKICPSFRSATVRVRDRLKQEVPDGKLVTERQRPRGTERERLPFVSLTRGLVGTLWWWLTESGDPNDDDDFKRQSHCLD